MVTPTPAAHLPTRQQLDEIDALLRRMLTLPPLAGEAAPEPAAPPASLPAPAAGLTYPAPTIREVPAPRPPMPGEPVVQEWRVGWTAPPAPPPSVVAWGSPVPLAMPAEDPNHANATPAYQPNPYQIAAPTSPTPVTAPAYPFHAPASAATPTISPLLWPLVALNVTFNVLTYLLGPLGSWLRGPGRTLIGWLGIGMILAAGVWAVGEWYGYDWPRFDLAALQAKLGLST